MSKFVIREVDGRAFPDQKWYHVKAIDKAKPRLVQTLRVKGDEGRKLISALINAGGPFEEELFSFEVEAVAVVPGE